MYNEMFCIFEIKLLLKSFGGLKKENARVKKCLVTGNIVRNLANGKVFTVMDKHSFSNVNRMFVQSYLVYSLFMECVFSNVLVGCSLILNVTICFIPTVTFP